MTDEQWGPGDKEQWRYWDNQQCQDGTPFKVFWGEHPHGRNDNKMYADFGDDRIVDFDGHRVRHKVVIEEANYVKSSGLSGDEVRKQCWADIYMNDKLCYRHTMGGRDVLPMLASLQHILTRLMDHPVQLWRPDWDGMIGRKVWYRDDPGVVDAYWPDQGALLLKADGGMFRPAAHYDDEAPDDTVKEEFLSPHIWWFRS